MRLLTPKEWETPKYLDDGIPPQKIYEIFDQVFSHISQICNSKGFSQEIFGVAMTLFHYYTYYKSLREFDRIEIAVACVFLACKIEFSFMRMDEAANFYYSIKNSKNKAPDFIKFEIEILSYMGFDINVETPHKYFCKYLEKKNPRFLSDPKIMNMGMKLINDSYRRNFCIFYSSKCIALTCLFITLLTVDGEGDETKLINEIIFLEKSVNATVIFNCLDNLLKILEVKFK